MTTTTAATAVLSQELLDRFAARASSAPMQSGVALRLPPRSKSRSDLARLLAIARHSHSDSFLPEDRPEQPLQVLAEDEPFG